MPTKEERLELARELAKELLRERDRERAKAAAVRPEVSGPKIPSKPVQRQSEVERVVQNIGKGMSQAKWSKVLPGSKKSPGPSEDQG